MNRRNFIHRAGRYALLTGLTSIGVYGIWKRKQVPAEKCLVAGYCKSCVELNSCNLPQAIQQKKTMK